MADKYGQRFKKSAFSAGTVRLSEDVAIVLNGRVIPVDEVHSISLSEASMVVLTSEVII